MNTGDIYQHFKGDRYRFDSIALPFEMAKGKGLFVRYVRYHDDSKNVAVYEDDGLLYVEMDEAAVLYHKDSTKKVPVWAREISDFFGYKELDAGLIRRFLRVETASSNLRQFVDEYTKE